MPSGELAMRYPCPAPPLGKQERSRRSCARMTTTRQAYAGDREDRMSKASDGIELTRVGPGTVMGDLMRCYWIPALLSSELERDGAPMRLMLLGERLIAFRDSDGRIG